MSYLHSLFSTPAEKELKGLSCTLCQNRNKLCYTTSPSSKGKAERRAGPRRKWQDAIAAQSSTQVETQIHSFQSLAEGRVGGENFQAAQLQQRTIQSLARSPLVTFMKMGTYISPPNTDLIRSRYLFSLALLPNFQIYYRSRSFQCSEDEGQALNIVYA